MATKPAEIIEVDASTKQICCDGGEGALGHPAVYYSFDGKDSVDCGYCGRRFVLAKPAKKASR